MEYYLENKFLNVKISSFGAELKSLVCGDTEYLWKANPDSWNRTAPVMFPITGGWEDDRYTLNNKTYKMRKHGFAVTADFCVISQNADKIVMQLKCDAETLRQYPFTFDLQVEYELVDKSVDIRITVKNLSEQSMPFAMGIHPGFSWPVEIDDNEKNSSLVFEKKENLRAFSTNGTSRPFLNNESTVRLERRMFIDGALCLPQTVSDCVDLKSGKRQIRIHKNDFKSLVLWTMESESARFLCIEPVTGFRNPGPSFLDHNGIITLKPKDSCSYSCRIEVIK